jgi:hypothetical protein
VLRILGGESFWFARKRGWESKLVPLGADEARLVTLYVKEASGGY